MKLVPTSEPTNATQADEEPLAMNGATIQGFYGPNDERYERKTDDAGKVSWYQLKYDEE